MDGFKVADTGWMLVEGRYFKEILRLDKPERVFYLYEGSDGFGIAKLSDGWLRLFAPLTQKKILAVARDLSFIVSDDLFRNWVAIGMAVDRQCLRGLNGPVELTLEICTRAVFVRLTRSSRPQEAFGQTKYLVEIEPLGLTLDETEFRLLVPALARALGVHRPRSGASGQD